MKKILVIEDERATRINIASFLESEGFKAMTAENGRVGIQMAQEHLPDLIICDILMPELDGYDVLITLQQDAKTASIPFIFLTMAATEAGFRQSLDMGADDYLSKPITSDRLRRAIAVQLQKQLMIQPPIGLEEPVRTKVTTSAERMPVEFWVRSARPAEPLPNQSAPHEATTNPHCCAQAEYQQYLQTKDLLFQRLAQGVRQQMTKMLYRMQDLKQKTDNWENDRALHDLQEDSARILVLVNEMTALYNVLTPENTQALLEQFNLMEESK